MSDRSTAPGSVWSALNAVPAPIAREGVRTVVQAGNGARNGPKTKQPLVYYADLRGLILKSLARAGKTQPQLIAEFPGIAPAKIRYLIRSMEQQGRIARAGVRPFIYTVNGSRKP